MLETKVEAWKDKENIKRFFRRRLDNYNEILIKVEYSLSVSMFKPPWCIHPFSS